MESPENLATETVAQAATDDAVQLCPRCAVPLETPPELAGLVVECGSCRMRFLAPELPAEAAEAPSQRRSALPEPVVSVPKSRDAGASSHWLGVLCGCACGLLIGYYVLNRMWGPQFDLLRVPLPGVAHTDRWRASPSVAKTVPTSKEPTLRPAVIAQATLTSAQSETLPEAPVAVIPAPDAPMTQLPASDLTEPPKLQPILGAKPIESRPVLAGGPPVRGARLASLSQLDQLLSEASQAVACPRCQATGRIRRATATGDRHAHSSKPQLVSAVCDACEGTTAAALTPEIYESLCRLAEAASFLEIRGAPDGALEERRVQLQALILRIAASREQSNDLGRLASLRIENSRRAGTGIALAGTVQRVSKEGSLARVEVLLFGRPRSVSIVAPHEAGWRPKDRVALLGTVVDHPRYNLTGYSGDLPQVVWGGIPVRLPAR